MMQKAMVFISFAPYAHIDRLPRQYLPVADSGRHTEAQGKTAWT
jgi:hypothetical protein